MPIVFIRESTHENETAAKVAKNFALHTFLFSQQLATVRVPVQENIVFDVETSNIIQIFTLKL